MRHTVRGINARRWVICEAGMCEGGTSPHYSGNYHYTALVRSATSALAEFLSKFFHKLISKKILYVYTQRFPSHLVKFENAKMLPNFHVQHDNQYV